MIKIAYFPAGAFIALLVIIYICMGVYLKGKKNGK
jgi:hypothetical protein